MITYPQGAVVLPDTDERFFLGLVNATYTKLHETSKASLETTNPTTVITIEVARYIIDTFITCQTQEILTCSASNDAAKKNQATALLKRLFVLLIDKQPTYAGDFFEAMLLTGQLWLAECIKLCQVTIVKDFFILTSHDFTILGGDENLYKHTSRIVHCMDWAMYQLHCEHFFSSISHHDIQHWPLDFRTHPQNYLKNCGFTLVQEPRPGDLLVFYTARKNYCEHVGIVGEDLQIYSKWGIGQLMKHPLLSTPIYYGDSYFTFRKDWGSQTLERWTKSEIQIPLPLTHRGGRKYVIDQIAPMLLQAPTLERSLYGKLYHIKLCTALVQELLADREEDNSQTTLQSIAQRVNQRFMPEFDVIQH